MAKADFFMYHHLFALAHSMREGWWGDRFTSLQMPHPRSARL